MAQILFLLESWVATVLWMAAGVAWHARRPRWWRWALVVLFGLALLAPWVVLALFVVAIHWANLSAATDTWMALTLLVTLILAVGWVVIRGLGRDKTTGQRRAASWLPGRLAVLALIVTVIAQSTQWMADSQLRAQLMDLRREAQVLAESVAPQSVVDSENAASLYRRAFDAMTLNYWPPDGGGGRGDEEDRPKLDAAPDEPNVPPFQTSFWRDVSTSLFDSPNPDGLVFDPKSPRLAKFLSDQRGVRDLIVRASKLPRCSFGRDYTRPSFDMLLPEVQNFRSMARYLAIDARQAAATGDSPRAKEDLETILRMANHCAEDPFLVCILVSMALEATASQALQGIVAAPAATAPGELLELTPPVRMAWLSVLDRSLRIEEAMGVYFLSQFGTEMDNRRAREMVSMLELDMVVPLYVSAITRNLFLRSSARELRDAYRELRDATYHLEFPTPEKWQQLDSLEKGFQTPFPRMLLPAIRSAALAALRAEARRRVTDVALGLYRYYYAPGPNGSPRNAFPESLNVLQPEYLPFLPSDPFTVGQPLRYRLTPTGAVVYSIADNFADDGGIEEEKPTGERKDIVFDCLAPGTPAAPAEN